MTKSDADEKETTQTKKPVWQNEEVFGKVEDLARQIRLNISEACQKGYEREDLIFLIQLLIKDFSAIKGTPFRFAIDNVITGIGKIWPHQPQCRRARGSLEGGLMMGPSPTLPG